MSLSIEIPKYKTSGIPRIMIPLSDKDFVDPVGALEVLKKYLPLILTRHYENRVKLNYFYNYYLGTQDILKKRRLYRKDAKNNNIIAENHAYRQINFKVAFTTSEKRDYAHKSDSNCEDTIYLDRYMTDVDFFSKDKNIKEWVFATGVGCSYQCHRTDIIEAGANGQFGYRTKAQGFDIETEAPFEFSDLDPRDNFVVYSSIRGNEPLFCVSLVEQDKAFNGSLNGLAYDYKIYIETKYARFVAKCSQSFQGFQELKLETIKGFHSIPMVEHYANNARIGIVELNRDLFNCTNTLVSNVLDMVVDGANIIMVFKNTDIKQETINQMIAKGALVLNDKPDNKNNSEAKLDLITIKIDFDGLNSFYEERLTQAYDIAGVPLASGQVTSGGDTGQARLLGGGWENARSVAKNDINTLLKADYAVLKLILSICKDIPACPLRNIAASQIDIKYHINQSDNLLTKAEAIAQLYAVNMPKETILKTTGLVSDVCVEAQKWETEDERVKLFTRETQMLNLINQNPSVESGGEKEATDDKQDKDNKETNEEGNSAKA